MTFADWVGSGEAPPYPECGKIRVLADVATRIWRILVAAQDGALKVAREEVVQRHLPRIYSVARRLVGNDADAEDVTQEVLLQVLQKLDTFRGEAALPTWLHRVTVNAALAHLRKKKVREGHRVHDPIENLLHAERTRPIRPWSMTAEQQAISQETRRLVENAIDDIPVGYREVLVLSDIEDVPNHEIADLLGLSLSAVKSRLHRARLMLRNSLAPHFEDHET
jgi:RNA polymerase sigma-70 factor, ECF subfamily